MPTACQPHTLLTDDDVDICYACPHEFTPLSPDETYRVCVRCGTIMFMLVELVYCDWRGQAMEGRC